jgi:deazaflavin-dependent oxidoreductase (nitroreductase family)
MAAKTPRPFTRREEKIGSAVIKVWSRLNTWAYRISGGRIAGRFPGGAPVLLLTTVGRKSGQPQTAPLLYLTDGDDYVVVASKGGMSHHPLWFKNLEANPRVEIEVGNRKVAATARRATATEKASLWPRLVTMYPSYADYQARTTRDIPVVILTPHRPRHS